MELSSPVIKITKIKKKTTAVFFKDVREGDHLQFSITLAKKGRGRAGLYATIVTCKNLTGGTVNSSKSMTEVAKLVQNFEYEELHTID